MQLYLQADELCLNYLAILTESNKENKTTNKPATSFSEKYKCLV